jgi:hypothetical protein
VDQGGTRGASGASGASDVPNWVPASASGAADNRMNVHSLLP